jgi:hypothetical protein
MTEDGYDYYLSTAADGSVHSQWYDPRVSGWVEEYSGDHGATSNGGAGAGAGAGGAGGGVQASPKGKGWPSTPPPKMRSPQASPKARHAARNTPHALHAHVHVTRSEARMFNPFLVLPCPALCCPVLPCAALPCPVLVAL